MNKKKVLMVAYPALNNSGVPAVIMGIVRELHDTFDFDVLVFRKDAGYHENEFKSYGGKVFHIDSSNSKSIFRKIFERVSRPWRLYWGTRKVIKKGHYDVIHCHNGFDSCWCLMAAKKEEVPKRVAHSHASINPFEKSRIVIRLYEYISRIIINNCSTDRIGCSQIAGDRLFGKANTTEVIVNAVDLSKFNPKMYPPKIFNKERPTFVFVGRLTEQKNPEFIINVFSSVQKVIPGAEMIIVGFGPKEVLIQERIIELKLEEHVHLLPHSSNIPEILSQSDFFLMPSFFEGLPVVLIESQSMGVYSFISDTVAKESDLGVCEFLSIQNGENEWVKQILIAIETYSARRFPSQFVLEQYSWAHTSSIYKQLYLRKQ